MAVSAGRRGGSVADRHAAHRVRFQPRLGQDATRARSAVSTTRMRLTLSALPDLISLKNSGPGARAVSTSGTSHVARQRASDKPTVAAIERHEARTLGALAAEKAAALKVDRGFAGGALVATARAALEIDRALVRLAEERARPAGSPAL